MVYLNALQNPYVYDDYHTVVENASLQHPGDISALVLHDVTRPLINISYAIDHALWGSTVVGYHVTNVLLHMLNVALLFALARRAEDGRVGAAFAAATLFAVHPMMTEAVGYISGRSELLCAVFFLSALLCGDRWLRGGGRRWAVAAIALWLASLASKEIGAMFPFVFFCYDAWVAPGTSDEKRDRRLHVHLPLIAAAIGAGLVRLIVLRVEYPGAATIHWSYVLLGLDVIRRYMWLMLLPSGQTIFHEVRGVGGLLDSRALSAIVILGLTMAFAWRVRRTSGITAVGLFWFFLLLLPSLTLTVLDQGEPMAEHRVYLASCGLFLAAGDGFSRLAAWAAPLHPRARALAPAALVLILLSFGMDTLLRNAMWRSPVALWRESVDLAPTHYRPRLLLGEALQDEGRRAEAEAEYKTAVRLRPADPTGYVKLGRLLAEAGQTSAARQQFGAALAVAPGDRAALDSIAILDRLEAKPGSDARRR
jgi:Flp pilus assembly protein TadD